MLKSPMRTLLLILLFFDGGILNATPEANCTVALAQVAQKVFEATQIPLSDPRIIGFHGTSEQAIKYLLRTGHLAPGYLKKGIFAHPSRSELNGHKFTPQPPEDQFRNSSYADDFGVIHAVMEEVGLENNPETFHALLADLDTFRETGRLREHLKDVSAKRLTDAFRNNISRRGFVVGISESAAASVIPHFLNGDEHDEVIIPTSSSLGVPVDHVLSIVPRGPREKSFVDSLRRK
jgi:hypothetical protein